MSATNTLETAVLLHILNGTAIAALSGVTTLYVSLHTADPGDAGSQNTSETTYTGYSRIAVSRDSSGWTVSGDTSSNTAEIPFGQCTASPGADLTHVGIGTASSGAGTLLLHPPLSNPIAMQVGSTPIFSAGELDVTCS